MRDQDSTAQRSSHHGLPAYKTGNWKEDFVCSIADALETDDEIVVNDRTRSLTVLGFEEQPCPGLLGGSDYPYQILWLRGNGTEYRMRWSHLGEYYPRLHTESELQTTESYSVKHGEPRQKTRSTTCGKRVTRVSVVGVEDENLSTWALQRNLDGIQEISIQVEG